MGKDRLRKKELGETLVPSGQKPSLVDIQEVAKENLLDVIGSLHCPFSEWQAYREIRETLSMEEQKKMQENIGKKDEEGKIEFIKPKIKLSVLVSKNVDNESIYDGNYIDGEGNKGVEGVIYLTGVGAEKAIGEQGKQLLKDDEEVAYIFSLCPGKEIENQIDNLVKLFELKKTGFLSKLKNKWYEVGLLGFLILSKPQHSNYDSQEKLRCQVVFGGKKSHMRSLVNSRYPMQYIVKEPI